LTVAVGILSGAGLTAGGALLIRAVDDTVLHAIDEQNRAELQAVRVRLDDGTPIGAPRRLPIRYRIFVRPDGAKVETQWAGPTDPPALDAEDEATLPTLPPLPPTNGPPPKVTVTRPLDDISRGSEGLKHYLVVVIPTMTALLTLAAWALIGRTLRPVRSMTQHAARIASASAAGRLVVPPTFDEVAELAHTLNGMLDRLAEGERRQREFVSDASHELRSPIAATRAQLEVALAYPDRAEPAKALRAALAETSRLEALVADLLMLARLDEGHAPAHEEIDLDDVVLEEAARVSAVRIDTRSVAGVKIRGERKGLSHLVRNLLDNAAKHAASRVAVTTLLDKGVPMLLVDDDGPGIPEADRARIFERFTRLSSSRSRDDGGAGLGLALVRRIAEQHGGVVRADRSPQGGARLEVRFPCSSDGL
jgi:signal transduction histidine kinase